MTLAAAAVSANFVITADACVNTTLAPNNGKCVVTLEFTPAAGTSGTLSGALSYPFSYGTNSGIVSVPLKGKVK